VDACPDQDAPRLELFSYSPSPLGEGGVRGKANGEIQAASALRPC
jgi:hypothetical protein